MIREKIVFLRDNCTGMENKEEERFAIAEKAAGSLEKHIVQDRYTHSKKAAHGYGVRLLPGEGCLWDVQVIICL